jgi:hypothetical protein
MKSWCTTTFQDQFHPKVPTPWSSGRKWRLLIQSIVHNLEWQVLKKFFTNELKMNPSKDPPAKSFMDTLRRWKFNKNLEGMLATALVLKNSYMC